MLISVDFWKSMHGFAMDSRTAGKVGESKPNIYRTLIFMSIGASVFSPSLYIAGHPKFESVSVSEIQRIFTESQSRSLIQIWSVGQAL